MMTTCLYHNYTNFCALECFSNIFLTLLVLLLSNVKNSGMNLLIKMNEYQKRLVLKPF